MQFDLPTAGQAEIISFPLERRRDLVRRVAAALEQREGTARDLHWERTVIRETTAMRRAGIKPAAARQEIAAFRVAVECEMRRRLIEGNDTAA